MKSKERGSGTAAGADERDGDEIVRGQSFLSQAGMDSYNQLSSVSYQDYVNRFESEVSEAYEKMVMQMP